jgi:hypothetical protein
MDSLKKFVVVKSVMATEENVELMDCLNADEDGNAAGETNNFFR